MRLLARVAVIAPMLAAAAAPAAARQAPPAAAPATDLTPAEAPVDAATADDAAASLTGGAAAAEPGDPLEGFNRAMWGFNQGVDKALIRPVTVVYRFVTPRPARRGLSRIIANLTEPWSFINNMLQAKPGRAMRNLGRFVVNTTIGVGGLADHATELGIAPAQEDFGQTLAAWGAKDSAYLVLPLFGPSTVRDGIGTGVASVADPFNVCLSRCTNLTWTQQTGVQAGRLVSIRSDLIESGADAFLSSSLDSYAAARSAYLQGRAASIADADEDGAAADAPANLDPASQPADPAGPAPEAEAPPAADPAGPPKLSFNIDPVKG